MRRLLSILLPVTVILLWAPPAHAALSVTISVSRTTLSHGSSVTFAGRAVDAKPGSVVKLQRKAPAGWRTVASKKVWATRSYKFTVTPPKGYQYYRVLKPRQLGQAAAVSRGVKLTVRWRPSVVLGEVSNKVDATTGTVTTTAGGSTKGLPVETRLQRDLQQPDGSWVRHGWTTIDADHTWYDTFAASHGTRLRYTAPAVGPRLAASSASFVVDGRWTPTITVASTMDSLTDEVTVVGATTGLSAGSTLQREYADADTWVAEGAPVPVAEDGSFSDSFAVTMRRDYRYTASAAGLRQQASSTPFAFTDAPVTRVSLNSTTSLVFPAGATERTLLLHLDQGQDFTLHSSGPWFTVSVADPSGEQMPGFGPAYQNVTATAPKSGDYTIRFAPHLYEQTTTTQITLSEPVVVRTALEDPGVDLRSTWPGQVVDLRFTAEGGSVISEYAAPHDTESGYTHGVPTLLDPAGAVIPIWGSLARQGANWQLPEASGPYTLRITPSSSDRVDRQAQSVLLGHETWPALDGAPGHLSLDRPGRVGVVKVTVPAGLHLDLSHIAEPGDVSRQVESFHPDGRPVLVADVFMRVDPTVAGTYTQLVSVDGTAEFDFYASTPAKYETGVGSTVRFDQGPAPVREALVRIPVTAGELFSFEVFENTGEPCTAVTHVDSGGELLEWATTGLSQGHPMVVKTAKSGDLVLGVTPCTRTGTFRLQPTTIVPSEVTETTTHENGYITTKSSATLEASAPGEVMIMEYDAGTYDRNWLHLRMTGSSFPVDTSFSVSHAKPGASFSSEFPPGTVDTLGTMTLSNVSGKRLFFVYAGPTATGTIELELSQVDY